MKNEKHIIESLLKETGIVVNGNNAWDPQIHNEELFRRLLRDGALGLGESYMDGWWDVERLDVFFERILRARLDQKIRPSFQILVALVFSHILRNPQSRAKAFEVGERHYDIGNDLYRAMLDKRLVYTCGYWKNAHTLDEAQEAKLDLVCRKLDLKPGQTVLDIGCGWGSFMKYAAEKYGVKVVGVTISKEQVALAQKLCAGLPIEIRLQDYRLLDEKFDHIVSLGMFEHVGYKNYRTYMEVAHRCLKDGGLFLLHTIGGNRSTVAADPWLEKYIFPNGMVPSIKQIGKSMEGLFVVEDWHNFGTDYDKTLLVWFENFDHHWGSLKARYGDRFYRMWKYFLLSSAAGFRVRDLQLWQIVLSKEGVSNGYQSVR